MKKLILLSSVFYGKIAFAQIGINTSNPKATLDISAKNPTGTITDTDGVIIPHVDRQRAQNMATIEVSTMIYVNDISTGTNSGKAINIDETGFYYFDGNIWQKLNLNNNPYSLGDIQYSARATDHNGWYLLNGRSITSLPAKAKLAAENLGLTGNLFDATDKTLKTKSPTENIGNMGGNASVTILQSNLPNVTLTGTANITIDLAGSHAHSSDTGTSTSTSTGFLVTGLLNGGYGGGSASSWGGTGAANTTASAGEHTHTFSQTLVIPLGGANQPIDNRSAYLALNTFIYLGE